MITYKKMNEPMDWATQEQSRLLWSCSVSHFIYTHRHQSRDCTHWLCCIQWMQSVTHVKLHNHFELARPGSTYFDYIIDAERLTASQYYYDY